MKKLLVLFAFALTLLVLVTTYAQSDNEILIQIALLLDTSNSMDGLISQAKTQLWKIVNEFALARKDGKIPRLQIALYEYGNTSLSPKQGYIRQISTLTNDLDKISEELFRLTTNGGEEFCGEVIEKATTELNWTTDNNVLKVIFIAGNEPFTQGSHDYRTSCKNAIAKGIIVNTIFCGDQGEGIRTNWKDGADLSDGVFSFIDQNQHMVDIIAPQDAEISRLGQELNHTYVAYRSLGSASKKMQLEQDLNAQSVAREAIVQRSLAKASVQYSNAQWDMVDALNTDSTLMSTLTKDQLPAELRTLNGEEQKKFIVQKAKQRKEIQEKINALNVDRRKFITDQQKKNAAVNTLDQAILNAVRTQAQKRNFVFE